jgi:isoleucyl-tRNA synthetase
MPPSRSRSRCADFKRLGVLGDWDNPYRTMDFANEAGEIRAFKRVIERGFVYRGLKPVYWCFDCGSSLAEFEIEYADKKSHTLDVAFECRPDQAGRRLRPEPADAKTPSPSSGPPPPGPSRQPGAQRNPELSTPWWTPRAACCCWPPALVEKCLERYQLEGRVAPPPRAKSPGGLVFRTRCTMRTKATTATAIAAGLFLADYATADDGTGIVHSSPPTAWTTSTPAWRTACATTTS